MDIITILLGVLVVLGVFLVLTYNGLTVAKVRVQQSWKDIDIQLKKRYDLLPDLIATAKKAAALDERILTEVTKLRTQGMASENKGPAERSEVEAQISSLMRDIKVQVEAYPDIKSHQELVHLMEMVTNIEEKIAYARQFYNSNTAEYNTKIKVFPAVLIASTLGFTPTEFFEAQEAEKEDIKVEFD